MSLLFLTQTVTVFVSL